MADWLIYWADFDGQRAAGWPPRPRTATPFDWWRTNNTRLVEQLCRNDRLWLFTSGMLCGQEASPGIYQTYLPQVIRCDRCDKNPEFDPRMPKHPSENVQYRVWLREEGSLALDPPLLVEDIIFPDGRDFPPRRGQTVGERLQTPRTLEPDIVRSLCASLPSGCTRLID
jgi:hypothetical protein